MAAELAPVARVVVVTRPESPRAGHWQGLAREIRCYVSTVYAVEDIKEAFKLTLALARPGELVCVTGSLYMVAMVRELIIKNQGGNVVL
ncbi:MAG: hypothetical protein PHO01_06660 [Desulfotomaculaceae bacterium]|nr:hypothetical protein [Desulfotomaculaceae bacterium]